MEFHITTLVPRALSSTGGQDGLKIQEGYLLSVGKSSSHRAPKFKNNNLLTRLIPNSVELVTELILKEDQFVCVSVGNLICLCKTYSTFSLSLVNIAETFQHLPCMLSDTPSYHL